MMGGPVWMRFRAVLRDPEVPMVALTAVVTSIVLANVIAIGPAALAARIRPAVALRSE
jgi:hypothetical protein